MHQMKLVVNPPASATISTGKFWNSSGAPLAIACSAMGLPAANANAMQALITPANTATQMPLAKLNSRIVCFLSLSATSRSFRMPAIAQTTMPNTHTPMPASRTDARRRGELVDEVAADRPGQA